MVYIAIRNLQTTTEKKTRAYEVVFFRNSIGSSRIFLSDPRAGGRKKELIGVKIRSALNGLQKAGTESVKVT
ncbi:hypothetical protein TNCT_22641 [Trichonephila clavata]|uniref:Uncharacterized protein n=1 Tax=Trichonephila clavata TaxID=2740835 RepID=A0A8X6FS85_TRICU|nr:hypothetical protein TNCT_22641 [Trichonephila clavata]